MALGGSSALRSSTVQSGIIDRTGFSDLRFVALATDTDADTTLAKVRLLSAAATYFNTLATSEYGGRLGPVREQGLVEQVIGAAFQAFGGEAR